MPSLAMVLISFALTTISTVNADASTSISKLSGRPTAAPKCEISFIGSQRESLMHLETEFRTQSEMLDAYNVNSNGNSIAIIETHDATEQIDAIKDLIASEQCAPMHATCEFRIGGGNGAGAGAWTSHYTVTTSPSQILFMNWDITTQNDPTSRESNETRDEREIRKQAADLKAAGICDHIHVLN